MDAMVTSRMPASKKKQGNEVIAALGTTPSRLIGELYDYIIREERLPDLAFSEQVQAFSQEEIRERYRAFIQGSTIPVDSGFWEGVSTVGKGAPADGMGALTDDEILETAVKEKYESIA